MPDSVRPPVLRARTRALGDVDDALLSADPSAPLVWARGDDVLVGIGVALTLRAGADPVLPRTARLAAAWRAHVSEAVVDDAVSLPGTGLIAFGSLVFDERSARDSVLIVPRIVLGRRGGRAWVTEVSTADAATGPAATPPARPLGPPWRAEFGPGALSADGYRDAVATALDHIASGTAQKVVLARDLRGEVPPGADLRRMIGTLATGYPDCWTFAVDGLVGASPETLVTASSGSVTARVLAGTAARGADPESDAAAAAALQASAKDTAEHRFAVDSVRAALEPHSRELHAADTPFALRLPNVWHLATDVSGTLGDDSSVLDLLGALHPTAAVAGTPTPAALDLIHDIEPFDRGRYAGPVGWVDHTGDGEWAIALRCAQFDDAGTGRLAVTAYAGAGIVPGSDPDAEVGETDAKLRPVLDAIG